MYVKPNHDHVPDQERGGYLSADGREVEASQYWLRRLHDGDVSESNPPRAGSSSTATRTARKEIKK